MTAIVFHRILTRPIHQKSLPPLSIRTTDFCILSYANWLLHYDVWMISNAFFQWVPSTQSLSWVSSSHCFICSTFIQEDPLYCFEQSLLTDHSIYSSYGTTSLTSIFLTTTCMFSPGGVTCQYMAIYSAVICWWWPRGVSLTSLITTSMNFNTSVYHMAWW